MAPETVSLVAAVVFLLIALVGGGLTAKEVVIPQIPHWARLVSALLGIVFAIPFALKLGDGSEGSKRIEGSSGDETTTIHSDTQFDRSGEQLRVSGLQALAVRDPPRVGDRITIRFNLDNVGEKPFQLAYTFIGARDPGAGHEDFGFANHTTVFMPQKTIAVSSSIIVDSAGKWKFWPCYAFERNGKEKYCPDEWKAFEVLVRS